MKLFLAICILFSVVIMSCKKTSSPPAVINCNGLVTDTSGTNDSGAIYMPNAFTPNGDGLNDIIRPYPKNIVSYTFTIYDENNTAVFTSTQLYQGWSTTVAANSFTKYYYKIQATTINNHQIGQCGTLYKLSCRPPGVTLQFEDELTQDGFFTGTTLEQLATCN